MKNRFNLLALAPLLFCLSSCDKQLSAQEAIDFVNAIGEELSKHKSFSPSVGTIHSCDTKLEDGLTTLKEMDLRFNNEIGSRYFYKKSVVTDQSQSESQQYLYEKDNKHYKIDLEGKEKQSKEYTSEDEFTKDFNEALRLNDLTSEEINYNARVCLFYISYSFDSVDKEEELSIKRDQELIQVNDSSFKFNQVITHFDSSSQEKDKEEVHIEFKDNFPTYVSLTSEAISHVSDYSWGKTTYIYPTIGV